MRINNIYKYILALPKTIYFNFKYFKFEQAIKLPVVVSHKTYLMKTKGKVILQGDINTGMIKIGFGRTGLFDINKSSTVWQVSGKVIFKGRASIGYGSKIVVEGEMILGNNFTINTSSSIICYKNIEFGSNCLLSWDILIMDTDFHNIYDKNKKIINEDESISIGDNVWIGCRSTILKGSKVDSNSVIGANTFLNKNIVGKNVLIAGSPAVKLKENIFWT